MSNYYKQIIKHYKSVYLNLYLKQYDLPTIIARHLRWSSTLIVRCSIRERNKHGCGNLSAADGLKNVKSTVIRNGLKRKIYTSDELGLLQ